jgi:hypothetical protein
MSQGLPCRRVFKFISTVRGVVRALVSRRHHPPPSSQAFFRQLLALPSSLLCRHGVRHCSDRPECPRSCLRLARGLQPGQRVSSPHTGGCSCVSTWLELAGRACHHWYVIALRVKNAALLRPRTHFSSCACIRDTGALCVCVCACVRVCVSVCAHVASCLSSHGCERSVVDNLFRRKRFAEATFVSVDSNSGPSFYWNTPL